MMQTRLFKKRILYVSLAAIVLYLVFRVRTKDIKFEVTINNSRPIDVWEYVADFSNMKKLNPTIVDFSILAESGNYDHWQYSAQYTEHLSHFPFIRNSAHAHFNVKPDGKDYLIHSTHNTCFLSGIACLSSVSEFRFSPLADNTRCTETITYDCPSIFSTFCHREVMHQREAIMANLKIEFAKKASLSGSL